MPMNTFDYKKVKDPQYFRDARMDAHSDHIYYRTKEEAEEKQSSYRVSLNGLWMFLLCHKSSLPQRNCRIPAEFICFSAL